MPRSLKRFQVSDKFAARKALPKLQDRIQIPRKEDEVVIHGGEDFDFGRKDARGRAIASRFCGNRP